MSEKDQDLKQASGVTTTLKEQSGSVLPARVEGNIAVVLPGTDLEPRVVRRPSLDEFEELREENIALFYRYIECENARDYEGMRKLFPADGFKSKTYFGNDPISVDAHIRMLEGLFRSFPDWYMVISDVIAADHQGVAGLITGRGTQYEEFFGRPPADHQIAIPTIHSIRCKDGYIVEHRHTNPFEDIFKAQAMAPLGEDIMAVRAQQGFDSGLAQRVLDEAISAGANEEVLENLRARVKAGYRQCQVLLKGTLRRCAMEAAEGEFYCEHHLEHGYGIDGIES